ncbi:Quinolinate phosphoribosyl transferase [Phlebopus sp. FC_14]|nr:Quinolinate phosphoribosyl transferase [Phlebopus sp. FC_14]
MGGSRPLYCTTSILDTDLYKFTMQQAVWKNDALRDKKTVYKFTHRDKDVFFPRTCIDEFRKSIERFRDVALTSEEREWLSKTCPYFHTDYLDYLQGFRFKPEQVSIKFTPVSDDGERGNVDIKAIGPWVEAILWEVPMMACLSELYFMIGDTDWDYYGQKEEAFGKALDLLEAGCTFSEFGTRRRRSYHTQDLVIASIIDASKSYTLSAAGKDKRGKLAGTSNLYFAKKYNIRPVGTIAHEWFMGIAALNNYENLTDEALELWETLYHEHENLLNALTDTFSTQVFFKDFEANPERAKKWKGLRQDSGNPEEFAPKAQLTYQKLNIPISTKTIIFSDALTKTKALILQEKCDELGVQCSFGIGTFLTNDFMRKNNRSERSRALNMVIKLASIDGKHCVKISDDLTKNTGDEATVRAVKKRCGLL